MKLEDLSHRTRLASEEVRCFSGGDEVTIGMHEWKVDHVDNVADTAVCIPDSRIPLFTAYDA
jgi:ornithine carbamoyltransferase